MKNPEFDHMPKVSVIIPTYNREKYITETINSVLKQTYSDYEIIVVDDGSTDNTEQLIKEQFGDKIIYLFKTNGGPASARNLGIRVAKGEYIAFLDSDDLWMPEKLEIQIDYMDAHPECGLSFTKALSFIADSISQYEDMELMYNITTSPTLKNLIQGNFIPNLTVITQKRCIDDVGGFDERKELIGKEDYELWIRVAMNYSIACIPRVLARYQLHGENLWAGTSIRKAETDYFMVIDCLNEKFPGLIKDMFGDVNAFYAERYRDIGDAIPFSGDLREKARLYRRSIISGWKRPDFDTLFKLALCCLLYIKKSQ